MFSRRAVLLVTIFVIHAFSLHMLDNTQAQIDALRSQQSAFQGRVNKLINNITQIEKSLNKTSNIDQKVLILQNAIISEREQVFNLSTIIIPPFNITKQGCEKMTDQQKVQLLQQLAKAKTQVNQLKSLAATMPKCDDIDQVKRDIQKQIFFLNSIQSIIYTNCSMNVILSPTIFQTNIYADNWVLGNMTIDDLIEQYYQRSIRYDNITNCPIQTPFFDGKQCINCTNPPQVLVFDISQKKCTPCPPDSTIDNVKRICVPNKYYTVWPNVTNFSPKDGPFPTPEPNAKPCPADKPYYNNITCIPCVLPNYFNVQTLKCQQCPTGQAFDVYDSQCSPIEKYRLTNLASRWVTGPNNFTNVLAERAKILQKNQTSGKYALCPPETPYFDKIKCIPCNQAPYLEFDLNTYKCVTAPNNTQFNPNIHNYLPVPEKPGETVPDAPNLLGNPPPNDPAVQDCPAQKPFWDGKACILCPQPFPLFDVSSSTCVACSPKDYYSATEKKCIPRPVIYIPKKEDNLLATPNVSIEDYKKKVADTIKNNPQAIIGYCNETQNSDFKKCFPCDKLFNVQTYQCDQCAEVYDNETGLCKKKGEIYTNFTSPDSELIINLPNKTQEIQKVNDLLKQNDLSTVCPSQTPFRTQTECINCKTQADKPFFDYVTKTCAGCTDQTFYLSENKCLPKPIVSNLPAVTSQPFLDPNFNLKAQQDRVANLNATRTPYMMCPPEYPYYNSTHCINIKCVNPSDVYDFSKKACVQCKTYDNATHTCPPPVPRYPYLDSRWTTTNFTDLQNKNSAWKQTQGALPCPPETPHYDAPNLKCVACKPEQTFHYDDYKCYDCVEPNVYNINIRQCILRDPNRVTKFPEAQNLIYGAVSQQQWKQDYDNRIKAGATDCQYNSVDPRKTLYFDGTACIPCPEKTPYFSLQARRCLSQCPVNSTYLSTNPDYAGCIKSDGSQVEIGPDIAKMYANVF